MIKCRVCGNLFERNDDKNDIDKIYCSYECVLKDPKPNKTFSIFKKLISNEDYKKQKISILNISKTNNYGKIKNFQIKNKDDFNTRLTKIFNVLDKLIKQNLKFFRSN